MGIFKDKLPGFWTVYEGELQFRSWLMGGVSRDPKLVEGALLRKLKLGDQEFRAILIQQLQGLGVEIAPDMTYEQILAAAEGAAAVKNTNGFLRDDDGLYISSYQMKAGLKETASIVHGITGEIWGRRAKKTGEGETGGKVPRSAVAEWVYVYPDRLHLGRTEPDGVHTKTLHVETARGPRDALGYVEYVDRARITFRVKVLQNRIKEEQWWAIWNFFEDSGLGADRAMGRGQFDLLRWDEVDETDQAPPIPLVRPRQPSSGGSTSLASD